MQIADEQYFSTLRVIPVNKNPMNNGFCGFEIHFLRYKLQLKHQQAFEKEIKTL